MRGSQGKRLALLLGGIGAAALLGVSLVYRDSLAVQAIGFRLQRRPGACLELLERPAGSPGGRALQSFLREEKGREFLLRRYLDEQIPREWRPGMLKASGTNGFVPWDARITLHWVGGEWDTGPLRVYEGDPSSHPPPYLCLVRKAGLAHPALEARGID